MQFKNQLERIARTATQCLVPFAFAFCEKTTVICFLTHSFIASNLLHTSGYLTGLLYKSTITD